MIKHIVTLQQKLWRWNWIPFSYTEYSRLLVFAPNNNFRHAIDSNKLKSNDSSNYSYFFYDKTKHLSEREIMVIINQVKQLMTK